MPTRSNGSAATSATATASILSLHPHNDRGTGVAAAELGVMAGADRVEGTLFGNGERTGNVDVVTLALNLFSQGVDPGLDISDIDEIVRTVEYCNQLPVHPRHPYAGELVYTAFSGSHQDAIKKGFEALAKRNDELWEVPYLPIDPEGSRPHLRGGDPRQQPVGQGRRRLCAEGRSRPRPAAPAADRVQPASCRRSTDRTGKEMTSADIWSLFEETYLRPADGIALRRLQHAARAARRSSAASPRRSAIDGAERQIEGVGNGPIDAFVDALRGECGIELTVVDYREHAVGAGADAHAAAYVQVRARRRTATLFGVGIDEQHRHRLAASGGERRGAAHRRRGIVGAAMSGRRGREIRFRPRRRIRPPVAHRAGGLRGLP